MKPIRKKIEKPVQVEKVSSGRSTQRKDIAFSLVMVSAQEREAYRIPAYGYMLP